MKISSPVFDSGEKIPPEYTCDGENVNPPLEISEVPSQVESLVLIMDDPDSPEEVFTHWLVWNIDPKLKEIGVGEVPSRGIQGINSARQKGYSGPCPPSGTHHYFFRLFALSKKLNLPEGSEREEVEEEMGKYMLSRAELMGLYSRIREEDMEEVGEGEGEYM